ncbi:MAG: hypothetical protein ACI83W_001090 [Marinoscillum sp.]
MRRITHIILKKISPRCNDFWLEPLIKKTLNTMKLQEAANLFERLKNETTKKSEIKIYQKFLQVLAQLERREFSKDEMQTIELELDGLQLSSIAKNRKKHFGNAFHAFEKKLIDTFSLITKGYYTKMGVGLGSTLGVLLGIIFFSSLDQSMGIALGLGIGATIGLHIGRSLDAKATSEGRVI